MMTQATNIPESDIEDRLRSDVGRLSGSTSDTFLSEISGGACLIGDCVCENELGKLEVCTCSRASGVIIGFANEARTRARVRLLPVASQNVDNRVRGVLRDLLTAGSIDLFEAQRLQGVFQMALATARNRARINELGRSQLERHFPGVTRDTRSSELERAYERFMEEVAHARVPESPPPDNRQPPALKPLSSPVRLIGEKRSRRRIIRRGRK